MRRMNEKDGRTIQLHILGIMASATSSEYARHILEHRCEVTENTLMEDVVDDVMCASAWDDEGYYNDDDIRLAIGRVLMERMGVVV